MKADVIVGIRLQAPDLLRIGRELDGFIHRGTLKAGVYEVRLKRGENQLHELLAALDELDLPYTVREERTFRPRELTRAPALHINPTFLPATTSIEGACPECHLGGDQVSDLVVLGQTVGPPAGFSITESGQILVNESVATVMISEGVSGCLLRGTRDPRGQACDLFQVLPTHTLPPLQSPPTRLETDPTRTCPTCGRGSLVVTSLLYYDLAIEDLCDFNVSTEEVSDDRGSRRVIVVSQRLFRLLCECDTWTRSVEPVVLV